jgi:hypothetical protein
MMERPERPKGIEGPDVWELTERFEAAKNEEKGSEDGVLVTPDCVAVFDGVSSGTSSVRIEGLTPGQFAVQAGMKALAETAQFSNEQDIVPHVSRAVAEAVRTHSSDSVPSFVFIAFLPKKNLVIRVGDCSYLFDGIGHNPGLKVDDVKGIVRKRLLKNKTVEEILQNDTARERVHELTKTWQPHFKNNPEDLNLGYAAVDGSHVPNSLVEYIPVTSEVKSIVLASDGYHPSILRETLAETEQGLENMIIEDPTGLQYNSTRNVEPVPDDRTYVKITRATS